MEALWTPEETSPLDEPINWKDVWAGDPETDKYWAKQH